MKYSKEEVLAMMFVGALIGFTIGFLFLFRATDRKYFDLRDKCRGVIGFEVNDETETIDFECVGGYEVN